MYMFLVFCISTCRQRIVWSLGIAGTQPDIPKCEFLRTCSLSIRQYQQSGIPSIPCIICGHTAIYCWILPTLMNKFGLLLFNLNAFFGKKFGLTDLISVKELTFLNSCGYLTIDIWWIPIILNIQVQQTSLHPPVWTLTGRQATWGASTSLIHDMMESHHMMELHHMMTFHHMKTFYLGYDGLQSF